MLDFYILIPYYNNADGLFRSLNSIKYIKEKYRVLIVDDGSVIPLCKELFPENIWENHLIELIKLPHNKGITAALNTGLEYILKKNDAYFIARLDCGDICMPGRFYLQVETLHANPEIQLLGTWCLFKDFKTGSQYLYKSKTTHTEIVKEMHWKCSFIHPTVMFTKKVLEDAGSYPDGYPYAEDYAFFFKICLRYQTQILPQALTIAEITNTGLSSTKRKPQFVSKLKVVLQFHKYKRLMLYGLLRQIVLYILPFSFILGIKKRWLTV
jgi:glycosyltransferase involved in cell wall biosynthesis